MIGKNSTRRTGALLERFAKIRSVTFLGEAMIELTLADMMAETASVGVAGDVLNAAYYTRCFAKPQIALRFATAIGDDPLSSRIRVFCKAAGILDDAIVTRPGQTIGLYSVSTDPDGERSFTYWRSASAARQMMRDGELVARMGQPDALYLSGITFAILPAAGRQTLLDWVLACRAKGSLVIFDPNYRATLWASQADAQRWMSRLLPEVDLVLPSFDDERKLWGDRTPRDTLARLTAMGCSACVVKNGAGGPIGIGLGTVQQHFAKVAPVIDTTGAGDSFNGRLIAELARGVAPCTALQRAHDLAGRVIQMRGAILPTGALE